MTARLEFSAEGGCSLHVWVHGPPVPGKDAICTGDDAERLIPFFISRDGAGYGTFSLPSSTQLCLLSADSVVFRPVCCQSGENLV